MSGPPHVCACHCVLSIRQCAPMKPAEMFDLSDDVAVVVGATGALGGALAEGLAAAGAKVAVIGRNAERGQARVKAIESKAGKAHFFEADAVRRDALEAAVQKSRNPWG